MRNSEWDQLHNLVQEAVGGLFASIGLTATYIGTVPHRTARWADTVSFIGLGGQNLKGSLVLSVPEPLLKRSHPASGTTAEDMADWLAELANLTLGRIKSRLLVHDVTIALSTPITISTKDLRFARFAAMPVVHEFEANGLPVYIVFECVSDQRAVLAPPRGDAVVDAGEMVMF